MHASLACLLASISSVGDHMRTNYAFSLSLSLYLSLYINISSTYKQIMAIRFNETACAQPVLMSQLPLHYPWHGLSCIKMWSPSILNIRHFEEVLLTMHCLYMILGLADVPTFGGISRSWFGCSGVENRSRVSYPVPNLVSNPCFIPLLHDAVLCTPA